MKRELKEILPVPLCVVTHSQAGKYEHVTVVEAGVTVENTDQYIPPATETLSYGADGNLLTDGRWTYTWDRENRLVKMESAYQTTPIAVPGFRLSFRYGMLPVPL